MFCKTQKSLSAKGWDDAALQHLLNSGTASAAIDGVHEETSMPTSDLTRLVGVSEVRAEVVHQVQVASLLDASANVPERLFGQLVQELSAQAQFVSFVGAGDLPVDVRVVGRVVPRFRTVDEALDLIGGQKGTGKPQYGSFGLMHV